MGGCSKKPQELPVCLGWFSVKILSAPGEVPGNRKQLFEGRGVQGAAVTAAIVIIVCSKQYQVL